MDVPNGSCGQDAVAQELLGTMCLLKKTEIWPLGKVGHRAESFMEPDLKAAASPLAKKESAWEEPGQTKKILP